MYRVVCQCGAAASWHIDTPRRDEISDQKSAPRHFALRIRSTSWRPQLALSLFCSSQLTK